MNVIRIQGAKTNNLQNISLTIPRDQLIVMTGLSGSGKSSLAFDTLYAEGQRRYVESLSAYARQFLSIMEKPDVEHIEGLSPAIAIEQKSTSHNPRSTVGTVTEIYDYLRLLFARVGEPQCPVHHLTLNAQSISQIVDTILALPKATKILVLSPVVREKKGTHMALIQQLQSQGFIRVRINNQIQLLDQIKPLSLHQKHTIEVVIDRLTIHDDIRERLAESIDTAQKLSHGLVSISMPESDMATDTLFSTVFACPHCGYSLSELEPRLFSFNSPVGACAVCEGLGIKQFFDTEKMLSKGLNKQDIPLLEKRYAQSNSDYVKQALSQYLSQQSCTACQGSRLRQEARHVWINHKNLPEISAMAIHEIYDFFSVLNLPGKRREIADKILKEMMARLQFLKNVGLDYLSLDRRSETLSGGEAQRIRLASQIGSALVGVMYILDEPSIGLHQRDNARLLKTLTDLRDLGNTVIVVEHDEEAILTADHVIDLGPGAGVHGGQIIAQGSPEAIMKNPVSLTGEYLSGKKYIPVPALHARRKIDPDKMIAIQNASGHNLKNININIPLGLLTCVTGVSGSGKSTLINDTLLPAVAKQLNHHAYLAPGLYDSITGVEHIKNMINIDQAPIGRTPRSNPATYTGIFTPIRELFSKTPAARVRGYSPSRFSFNVKGGRCEACEGDGVSKIAMNFLPDIYVACDICQGKRYNRESLEIYYKNKNIHDVLNMTIEEALLFFNAVPVIAKKLHTLMDVGLGYIRLGQSAISLSGGEAQRIKLSKELSKRNTGNTLYILDEPTTGLHFHDIAQLLIVLHQLRDQGNTVVIIEHNLDVIKTADWIIDLGPEGGIQGGYIVAEGTPEDIASKENSHTGIFLKKVLKDQQV